MRWQRSFEQVCALFRCLFIGRTKKSRKINVKEGNTTDVGISERGPKGKVNKVIVGRSLFNDAAMRTTNERSAYEAAYVSRGFVCYTVGN